MSCSEDLPQQGAVPGTGTSEEADTAAGGGSGSAGTASMNTGGGMSTGSGMSTGTATGTAGSGAGGMSGGTATSGSGAMSMSAGGTGGGTNGTGMNTGSAAGGGAPMMRPMHNVAACMGRDEETICDGAVMVKCGVPGTSQDMREPCQNEARCRAGLAEGKCGACDPGVAACMGKDLYECNMGGVLEMKQDCLTDKLCDDVSKSCEPPACDADEYKCEGGSLLKCDEGRTKFTVEESCPMELCDATGKKCNECIPSSKTCEGTTLQTCSSDGKGPTETECTGETAICDKDKCVQCVMPEDCKAPNDCQTVTCMANKCTAPQSKTVGTACTSDGGKKCDLVGNCVACNTDFDCESNETCSLLLGCIERASIVAASILPGRVTVQINAGHGLKLTGTRLSDVSVTYSGGRGGFGGTPLPGNEGTLADPDSNSIQIVTFTGMPAAGTCLPFQLGDVTATLYFAATAPPISADSTITLPDCSESITVSAF